MSALVEVASAHGNGDSPIALIHVAPGVRVFLDHGFHVWRYFHFGSLHWLVVWWPSPWRRARCSSISIPLRLPWCRTTTPSYSSPLLTDDQYLFQTFEELACEGTALRLGVGVHFGGAHEELSHDKRASGIFSFDWHWWPCPVSAAREKWLVGQQPDP